MFTKRKDPRATLSLGARNRRVFKSLRDISVWALLFPDVMTDGFIDDWTGTNPINGKPFFNGIIRSFDHDGTHREFRDEETGRVTDEVTYGKLYLVKWVKEHLRLEDDLGYLGLRDSKTAMDFLQILVYLKIKAKENSVLSFEKAMEAFNLIIGQYSEFDQFPFFGIFNSYEEFGGEKYLRSFYKNELIKYQDEKLREKK